MKAYVIYRKCNTFKEWSVDVIVPDLSVAKYYLSFGDFESKSEVNFIKLKRKCVLAQISIRKIKEIKLKRLKK